MKTNQYKITIYRQPDKWIRVEIWWYEKRPNPITGKVEKLFQWAEGMFQHDTIMSVWIGNFFAEHFEKEDASWPLTADRKEPKRDKNNQTDFQF